jgi:hypothetical protein
VVRKERLVSVYVGRRANLIPPAWEMFRPEDGIPGWLPFSARSVTQICNILTMNMLRIESSNWHMECFGLLLPMKEVKTGFLMLLVCVALYIQVDPRIWTGICQLLARCMVGWN